MSGQQATGATELQAAARRLAALADRLRAVRAHLAGNGGDASRPADAAAPGGGGGVGQSEGQAR